MARSLDRQAADLYRHLLKLVRQYQFRDREEICCNGISVSQCYALAHIRDERSCTMGDLASALSLDLSTITRLADQLETKRLIQRTRAEHDRRVCHLNLTRQGSDLLGKIEEELVVEYRAVLTGIPAASREAVLDAIAGLGKAFEERKAKKKED
jgi:MarR family 2-MHQ and catechol resistance regulon transcriptional repressor